MIQTQRFSREKENEMHFFDSKNSLFSFFFFSLPLINRKEPAYIEKHGYNVLDSSECICLYILTESTGLSITFTVPSLPEFSDNSIDIVILLYTLKCSLPGTVYSANH